VCHDPFGKQPHPKAHGTGLRPRRHCLVRRCVREREELVAERVALVNRIGAVLATLDVDEYNPLLRNRRERLDALRTALGTSLPPHAHAKISRMLDRLDLVRAQIANLEQERDAVLENEAPDRAGEMIQQLATLRGIGVQSATVLVREAFVREFANGKALGSYAGLCATPYGVTPRTVRSCTTSRNVTETCCSAVLTRR